MRSILPSNGLWFAPVSPETGEFNLTITEAGKHRNIRARKDLQGWLKRVDLPYHSPNKFRHVHAVYALKNAKDVPALKAVSQNLMHANLSITDGVYGMLSELDFRNEIIFLGKDIFIKNAKESDKLVHLMERLIKEIENNGN